MRHAPSSLPPVSEFSRRDFLKSAGIAGLAPFLTETPLHAEESKHINSSDARIVIIGGGAGGICVAARLCRAIDNPNITVIEPSDTHYYQAGFTLVGSGIYAPNAVVHHEEEFMPSDVKWVKEAAADIDADSNTVILQSGKKIVYDYLVLAPGIQMDFHKIEGFDRQKLGENDIHCIYDHKGSIQTFKGYQKLKENGGEAVFCDIDTPIKCGGAPKKINLLCDAYLNRHGGREKTNLTFMSSSSAFFAIPVFAEALEKIYARKNIDAHLKHTLKAIDPKSKTAYFEKATVIEKQEYDEILEETVTVTETKTETVTRKFDFLHAVPPMSAPDFVKRSALSWDKGSMQEGGWAKLDPYTLQHLTYKNVFGLGDVAGIPFGKTGGSVRKQAPILVANLLAEMEGKKMTEKSNGYTVCPILTEYGTVLLAEFGYDKKLLPTLPFIDPAQERYLWWILKTYILHPMYSYGMMKGIA